MMYSKTADEIIRELNSLIVQAKETAAFTRKNKEAEPEAAAFYAQFWEFTADRAEAMADSLTEALNRITAITQRPDEISARFMIMKAIEYAAFQSSMTAFQTGLMISRAKPGHREAFQPICRKYKLLSQNARIKADKIAEFFRELSALIFQNMRKDAEQKIEKAVEKGKAAAKFLLDHPDLPYTYIADGLMEIADELSSTVLEELTVCRLEDYLFRLDMIAYAADMDVFRAPSHKPLFDGILDFKEQLSEAAEFFQNLSEDMADMNRTAEPEKTLLFQGNILLFYLKGEIKKLGDTHLKESQKASFDAICQKLDTTIHPAHQMTSDKLRKILREVYEEMTAEAGKLGVYGAPVQFITEELLQVL